MEQLGSDAVGARLNAVQGGRNGVSRIEGRQWRVRKSRSLCSRR